jgi:DNA adenine methylase
MLPGMRYPGGKSGSGVCQTIINQMPPHQVYLEPFLGGGAVLLAKAPALINVGVDADPRAIENVRSRLAIDGDGVHKYELVVGDAISYLRRWRWWTGALVYCDPPYLMETRSSQRRYYRCELEGPGHIALLQVLCHLPCYVMVSGYPSELYDQALSAWRVVRYRTMTRGGRMAEECLWCNYPEPVELHDYRFLGRDFRERERVRRRRSRWVAMLARMPVLERAAVVSDLMAMSAEGKNRQDVPGSTISGLVGVLSLPGGGGVDP